MYLFPAVAGLNSENVGTFQRSPRPGDAFSSSRVSKLLIVCFIHIVVAHI